MKNLLKLFAIATVFSPGVAGADVQSTLIDYGASFSAGGGFAQFTDNSMRDYATQGAGWEGRIAFGTKKLLTIEAAYVGSVYAVDALGLDNNATLFGNGVEGNLRVNLTTGKFQPFFVAGAGWSQYRITNTDTNTSDMSGTDNIAQFPVGVGVGLREGSMLLDARAVYRPTSQVDMFAGATDASMASWSATVRVGFEY